ncbi:ImmA/IrrE family metallo-endopeptidase [Paraburkholderia fungorum]|uniref:ImmA/IrrE family metallo-endopeptidase n=1 Tax=Paraburkholderia fungorum TaxID=134537 RepID=UPI003C6DF11A
MSTRRGMSIQQYRSVLAHELGHAAHGDTPTGNGHYDQRQERHADEYAARLLISPVEFEAAATWHHGRRQANLQSQAGPARSLHPAPAQVPAQAHSSSLRQVPALARGLAQTSRRRTRGGVGQ